MDMPSMTINDLDKLAMCDVKKIQTLLTRRRKEYLARGN